VINSRGKLVALLLAVCAGSLLLGGYLTFKFTEQTYGVIWLSGTVSHLHAYTTTVELLRAGQYEKAQKVLCEVAGATLRYVKQADADIDKGLYPRHVLVQAPPLTDRFARIQKNWQKDELVVQSCEHG